MVIDMRVTEILTRIVKIDAQSIEDAISIIKNDYKQEKIVLDESDFNQNLVIEKKEDAFSSRRDALANTVIQYLMKDEKKHWMECGEPKENHIYLTLKELQGSLI